jgi:hypothetical protein
MADVSPVIKERGANQAARNLADMGLRARDVRPAKRSVQNVFRRAQVRHYATRGDGEWPSLAQSTREAKARKGLDPRVMHATNALYDSLVSATGAGSVSEARASELEFGTSVPYARFHKDGRGVPKRDPIGLTARDREAITETLSRYIAKNDRT